MIFRNLGAGLSSDLIREATERTYREWINRYGSLPEERLRTEIGVHEVRSTNPGYCYLMAGWERGEIKRGKLFLYAPEIKDGLRGQSGWSDRRQITTETQGKLL